MFYEFGIKASGRTSTLDAPIMLLTGHQGEIFSVKFHPEGDYLVSAGFDRQIREFNLSNSIID